MEQVYADFPMRPKRYPSNPNVICTRCKKFSGWTNADLALLKITKDMDLKCEECGEITIRVKANTAAALIIDSESPFTLPDRNELDFD